MEDSSFFNGAASREFRARGMTRPSGSAEHSATKTSGFIQAENSGLAFVWCGDAESPKQHVRGTIILEDVDSTI